MFVYSAQAWCASLFLIENQHHTVAMNMYYSVSTAPSVFAKVHLHIDITKTHQRKTEGKRSFSLVWTGPEVRKIKQPTGWVTDGTVTMILDYGALPCLQCSRLTWRCRSPDWRWGTGFGPKTSSGQKAARRISQHLSLWTMRIHLKYLSELMLCLASQIGFCCSTGILGRQSQRPK